MENGRRLTLAVWLRCVPVAGEVQKHRYIRIMRRTFQIGIAVLVLAGAAAGAAFLSGFAGGDTDAPQYKLARVERGPVASTVSASGTLSAVVTVEVGSQVSGLIQELEADFNSEVKAGQVIARIDPANFEAKVAQAEADVAVAKANVSMQVATRAEQEANILGFRAAMSDSAEDLKRKQSLFKKHVIASSVVDKAKADFDQARAKVIGAQAVLKKQMAQIEQARAQVKLKEAALKQQRLNLDYTFIRSPVNGVVINRNVDVGQTVAASLQAPVLFTIAQDLRRMRVEVSVDEADIGQVREGQPVTFTVDSYAGREFRGEVQQIRKAGKEVSNVVTYTVVVSADNPAQLLLPGMTANVTIIVHRRENALKVANAALRFNPPGVKAPTNRVSSGGVGGRGAQQRMAQRIDRLAKQLKLTDEQKAGIQVIFRENGQKLRGLRQQGMQQAEFRVAARQLRIAARPRIEALLDDVQRGEFRKMMAERASSPTSPGRLWVLDEEGRPKPVRVVYGISDGTVSEIVGGDIRPGQQVIVGVVHPELAVRRGRPRFGL